MTIPAYSTLQNGESIDAVYRTLFLAYPDALVVADGAGRIVLANPSAATLLGYGVIAGPIYVAAVAVQMMIRDGFDPTRHAASQLANGDLGWIQIATFLLTGAMTIAAAVGVRRALGPGRLSAWAALAIRLRVQWLL